jgi:cytochrome d ubiquinol oxidase subunit II
VSGTIDTSANNYVAAYIFSWLGFFPITVGFFTIAICGFMAAIFIIGETDNAADKKRFTDKAKHFIIGALVLAVVVFIASIVDGVPLSHWLFGNPISIACMSLAGASLVWLWIILSRERTGPLRTIAGAQVTLLLIAITYEHYPVLINLKNAKGLSLIDAQGGPKTIMSLGIALLAGSVFILPFLYYLLYSFTNYERE